MTRRFLIIPLLALASCNPEQASRDQAEADKKLEETAGYLGRVQSDTREIKRVSTSEPINEYRQQQLQKAAANVTTLSKSGRAANQIAASLLIAEGHSSQARMLSSNAERAWTSQGGAATDLITLGSRIRLTASAGVESAKVDFTKQLTELQDSEKQLQSKAQEFTASAAQAGVTIKELQGQITQLTASQKAKSAEADDFSRKAFAAKGQAQYDLYVKVGESTRAADQFNSKADVAQANLSVAQSQQQVEQARLDGTNVQLKATQDALTAINARITQLKTDADESKATLDKLINGTKDSSGNVIMGFVATLDKYTKTQADIAELCKKASAEYDAAVKSADEAMRSAPEDGKVLADLTAGAALAEQGFLYRQLMLIQAGYAEHLKNIGESVTAALPAQAPAITTASTDAAKQSADAKEQAVAILGKAITRLDKIATAAKTKDKAVERAAIQNLILANASLGVVSADAASVEAKVKELRDRLNALGE